MANGRNKSKAATYDVIREYQSELGDDLSAVNDPDTICVSPSWAIAVIPLGRPQSFSRRTNKSIGKVVEGAFTRRQKPFVITSDILSMSIRNSKRNHTKSLQAVLQNSGVSYLGQNAILPGDWVFAWCWNNTEDAARVLKQIDEGKPANGFSDGLKFVGRVHSIRKSLRNEPRGKRSTGYSMQATGFEELDTQFFYDFALATASAVKSEIRLFMAQLGLDFSKWAEQQQQRAGRIKDNADILIERLVDIILGKGVSSVVNEPIERAVAAQQQLNSEVSLATDSLKLAPQANKEAPYAYLIPVSVATILGRDSTEKSKAAVFGYADILDTIIGAQQYSSDINNSSGTFVPKLFYPEVDTSESTKSRKRTAVKLKGTFLPVNPSFVNRPLFQMLQQFLNPAINEMYTALRVNENGAVVPTLVVRQIPFSTESAKENEDFPLTRFLSLPRWKLSPTMVWELDVGMSNATRFNMIHVYGEAATYAANRSVTNQMVRNPPIFDSVDIQRSGIRAMMTTVNCALTDQVRKDGARIWMEAIADWTMGSQYTLNGVLKCVGIQSPIAEGDNIEFEEVAYHVEGVTHNCSISPRGIKTFRTDLELSNGMPVDQDDATADFPRYPGFKNHEVTVRRERHKQLPPDVYGPQDNSVEEFDSAETDTDGDDELLTRQDPGSNSESNL
jgi:hypothetical protein